MPSTTEDWAITAAKQFAESANATGLKVPIEAVAEVFRQMEAIDVDLAGIDRRYSTEEAAQFFAKSWQWMYWAMKPREEGGGGLFYYPDGRPIEPERIGNKGIRRFTLNVIKDMGVSLYQRGTIKLDDLQDIVKLIHLARIGQWAPTVAPKQKKKRRGSKNAGVDQS